MKLCFSSLLLFVSFSLLSQDLKFFPIQGAKNHSGESDFTILSSKLEIKSDKLVFTFDIQDDEVSINSKDINSDHLEFWFSLDNKDNDLLSIDFKEDKGV